MKYIVLIGDGMSDHPIDELGGKTPLEVAATTNMDFLAREGTFGMVNTIPQGFPPGSDVAALSILGYDPAVYYTGRSPLEAASMGVELSGDDLALRCNLVALAFKDGSTIMEDFSAGHISTEEAEDIIRDMNETLASQDFHFYLGKSYRHLFVWNGGPDNLTTTPPHDISGREIEGYLPKGEGSEILRKIMSDSQKILRDHPVNRKRVQRGVRPANSLWFWGEGKAPELPTLKERFFVEGSVISAVDLIKGIGIYAGLKKIEVPGATGYIDTNYRGKGEYALKELEERDFVLVHVEAPDEAGHNGDLKAKIKAIEDFDKEVVGRILNGIKAFKDFRILLMPDHATPVSIKTHTVEAVPFVIYPPIQKGDVNVSGFNEPAARSTGLNIEEGYKLLEKLFDS